MSELLLWYSPCRFIFMLRNIGVVETVELFCCGFRYCLFSFESFILRHLVIATSATLRNRQYFCGVFEFSDTYVVMIQY